LPVWLATKETMLMPTQGAGRSAGPYRIGDLLALHARELAAFMLPPAARDPACADPTAARSLAEEAALYALAAFDPQDAADAAQIRTILTATACALDGKGTAALSRELWASAAMLLRAVEQRQVRMRMRDAPAIPGRRRTTPRQLETPSVVPLPEGVAHWLDLITDPALRRRLDAG
jgi:hypothetical protein